MKKTHGSLFSGFDAPSIAASWMGWENAFHCEINPFCNEILKYWFPDSEHYEDITKTDFSQWRGRIDILTGGFPCQPFSLAGQRKGADDNRYLWPHMLRAIREIRPAWVIGENVAGILTMVQPGEEVEVGSQATLFGEDNRKRVLLQQEYVVETICKDLEREGYSVQPLLIPACAVGAPHRRDRVWVIAHRNDVTGADDSAILRNSGENACTGRKEWIQKRDKVQQSDKPDNVRSQTNRFIAHSYSKRHTSCGTCEESEGYRGGNNGESKERKQWPDGLHGFLRNASDSNDERLQGCSNNRKHPKEREKSNDQQSCRLLRTDWQVFPTQPPVCRGNDGLPFDVDNLTIPFTKWRQESVKGYGNAIVPQVILEIFKAIEELDN